MNKSRGKLWLIIALITISAVAFGVRLLINQASTQQPVADVQTVQGAEPEERPASVSSRLLIFGDVFWGRYFDYYTGTDKLFSKLDTFERNKYDAWVATLECPIAKQRISYQTQVDNLKFNCQPEHLPKVKKWFSAFNIGSNHNSDQEEYNGFEQTKEFLDKAGIQYFGHHQNKLEDICEVLSFPARTDLGERLSIPIAFCGYDNVFTVPTEAEIAVISQYAKQFVTIAMPQMGNEYVAHSDALKETAFKKMIEAGADLVVGGQPHWVQNSEVYKGKLIMYSMGNFIFDQWFDADVQRGVGLDATITIPYTDAVKEWSRWVSKCNEFNDDCLARARGLVKPKVTFEFDLIATDNYARIPRKGDASLLTTLKQRTNWQNSLKDLGQ